MRSLLGAQQVFIQGFCSYLFSFTLYFYNKTDFFCLCFSLNAIREVAARCPLAINEDLLQDLSQYKTHKDKSK